MPYQVTTSGAGPWVQGEIIPDADFNAHPGKAKFLRTGSIVAVGATAPPDPAATARQLADLDAQIAQLQAQRATVSGAAAPTEPHAPALVAYDLDRLHPPTASETAATRAAGVEVLQPSPGVPVAGTVVPGEAAETPDGAAKKDKK